MAGCTGSVIEPGGTDPPPPPPPGCGDGVIGPAETCDPPSSCPADCDDGNACTQDVQSGSAASCNVNCAHVAITTCDAGDGCCAAGCDASSDSDCSASCGDSVLDLGETCDPPESCPTVCDDGNGCTSDFLTGSASACSAACGSSPISTCDDGDGCCASGCDATADSDCSASCGNGILEAMETCDPPSSCPTSCDDTNACTRDTLTGSAASCSAACSNTVIVSCNDGDGCCPTGCDATTDDDCSASCGNGTVEPGETCDPPGSCPTSCSDGDLCTADQMTGSPASCSVACSNPIISACTDGDGCCPGGCDHTTDADCPGGPLDSRLRTSTLTTPEGVKAGVSNWRIWGTSSLRISRVFTVPLADCGTLVGYTTGSGTSITPRVARLDGSDALVTTHSLTAGLELRGLAAEPDGHFAALLWSNTDDRIWVYRYDHTGAEVWNEELTNSSNTPTSFGIGESRLEYGDGRYGAYYHVHSDSGHEGDTLKWVTTAGVESTGWSWGCSHSMSNLLRFNPATTGFMPACVTDCYPGTSGSFSTNSIGGIYLNHRSEKVMDVDGGCNGRVAGELGGAALAPGGWTLVFNAHQNPATPGQSSYDSATMNQDIGFSSIDSGLNAAPVVWLTSTSSIDEADSTIARWEPDGDATEQYVVGWAEPGASYTYKLARVSASGSILEGPLDVTGQVAWGRRDDPMRQHYNGDVVWAWFDTPGSTTLQFARLQSGGSYTCASF